jgi:hypothetical protein
VQFKELFRRFDRRGTGKLRMQDLHKFLEEILGSVSRADVQYFQAVLDADGDGAVTADEFKAALREVQQIAVVARSEQAEAQEQAVLNKLSGALTQLQVMPHELLWRAGLDVNLVLSGVGAAGAGEGRELVQQSRLRSQGVPGAP